MCLVNESYKLAFIVLLLLTLVVCKPLAAQEQTSQDAYFRLIAATCYTCHSPANHDAEGIPRLQELSASRIRELLTAYKTDALEATIMGRISKGLSDAEIERVSVLLAGEEASEGAGEEQ